MKRIASYARKSVYSDKSDSTAVQHKMIEDYCKHHYNKEYTLTSYEDEGYTGANTNRPAFAQLIEDIKNDLIDTVICYRIDRISRNVKDFSSFYSFLEENGVGFISLTEQIDTSTPLGKAMLYISSVFSQMERETISERVKDNMLQLAISGKWTGGPPPPGYRIIKRNFGDKKHSVLAKITEDADLILFLVNKLLDEHMSVTRLERYVVRNHLVFPGSGKAVPAQLYRLLSNPVYCAADQAAYDYFSGLGCKMVAPRENFDGTKGLATYGRTVSGGNGKVLPYRNWSVSVGYHEPVYPFNVFLRIQSCFTHNLAFKMRKYDIGLLRGIIRCKCGTRMQVARRPNKTRKDYQAYFCVRRKKYGKDSCDQPNLPVDLLDKEVLSILKGIRLDKEVINNYIPQKEELHKIIPKDSVEKAIRETENKISNWLAKLEEADGTAASKYIINQITSLDLKKQTLEQELSALKRIEIEENKQKNATENTYQKICKMVDNLEELSYCDLNSLLTEIIVECRLGEDGTLHIIL